VRANAIEVIESKSAKAFIPLLMQRARVGHNRERANAIKALHRMKVGVASPQLVSMMRDERADHRISALWALKQIGFWQLLREVAQMARADDSMKVRRYALAVIKVVSDSVQAGKVVKAG
jgi:HEAT repeat protein